MNSEQNLPVVESGKAENERRNAQSRDKADGEAIARKHARKGLRPGIDGVGFGAGNRKRLRHIDVEFMRRRELAVGITGTAGVAEIGEIIEVAVGKRAAHFHRRKYRAQALAIAARIA